MESTSRESVIKIEESDEMNSKSQEREPADVFKVKKTPVSNVLMFHDTEMEIYEHNKVWIEFAKTKLNLQCQESRLISKQHVQAGTSVKLFLLKNNMIVFCYKNSKVIPMRLMMTNTGDLVGKNLQIPESVYESINFKDIVTDATLVKNSLTMFQQVHMLTGFEPSFYNIIDFHQAQNYVDQAIFQVIQPGLFFEMQLAESPHLVVIAKVLKNYRGLLLVGFEAEQRWIHMFDPLCHALGWTGRQNTLAYELLAQQVTLIAGYSNDFKTEAIHKQVPSFVFRNNYIVNHRIMRGDILALADQNNTSFWYAHVVEAEVNSRHFFYLKTGGTLVRSKKRSTPQFFHIYHPRIFSVEKIKAAGLPIMLPEQFNPNPNETDIAAYIRAFSPSGRVLGKNIGVDYQYNTKILKTMSNQTVEKATENLPTLKFIEVLRSTATGGEQMTAAMVTGYKDGLLRVRVPPNERYAYYHFNDPRVFHFGSCVDMSLAIDFNKEFMEAKRRESKTVDGWLHS